MSKCVGIGITCKQCFMFNFEVCIQAAIGLTYDNIKMCQNLPEYFLESFLYLFSHIKLFVTDHLIHCNSIEIIGTVTPDQTL